MIYFVPEAAEAYARLGITGTVGLLRVARGARWARSARTSSSRPSSTSTRTWCAPRSPDVVGAWPRPRTCRGPLRRGRRGLPPHPGRRRRRVRRTWRGRPSWPASRPRRRAATWRAARSPRRMRTSSGPSEPHLVALARPVDPARVPGRRPHRPVWSSTGCRGWRRWSPTPPPATCPPPSCGLPGLVRRGVAGGGRRPAQPGLARTGRRAPVHRVGCDAPPGDRRRHRRAGRGAVPNPGRRALCRTARPGAALEQDLHRAPALSRGDSIDP